MLTIEVSATRDTGLRRPWFHLSARPQTPIRSIRKKIQVSIDAMYWVWNHSRSKGTGRHIMLACANWVTGPDCTVRASTAELVQFSNAARSSVIKAIDALVKSGELELLEEARGTRSALYQIPGAVGYVRPDRTSRGPKTGPLGGQQRSGNETSSPAQGSENETPSQNARGPETRPLEVRKPDPTTKTRETKKKKNHIRSAQAVPNRKPATTR